MSNLFVQLLFGHIVGDYFLQPQWMAVKKGSDSLICTLHAFICALVLMMFVGHYMISDGWGFFCFVFITHFLIDRFSLGDKWSKIIGGRILTDFFKYGQNTPSFLDNALYLEYKGSAPEQAEARQQNYRILNGAFTAIVYLVIDNSAHLMLYWYGYPYFH